MVPNEALEKKGISQFLKLIQAKSQLYERKYEAGTKSDLDESKRSHLETGPLELSGNTQNLGETAQRLKSLSASIENSCKKYLGSLDDRIISDVITKALDGPLKSYIRGEAELFFNIEETKEKKLEITGFKFENCKEIEAQKKPILDALKVDKMLELVPPTDPFHENLLTLKTKFTFNPDFTEQDFKASLFQILSEQEPNYDNIDVKAFKEARFIAAQNSKPAEPDNSAQVESGLETVTNYCKMAIRQIEETMKRNVIEAGIKGSDVEINAPLEAIKNQYSELYEKCSKLKNPNKEMVQALVSRVLNDEAFKQKIEQIEVLSQDDVFKGWHYVKYHIDNLQAMSDPEFNFKKEKDQQQRDSVAPSGIDQMIKLLEDKKAKHGIDFKPEHIEFLQKLKEIKAESLVSFEGLSGCRGQIRSLCEGKQNFFNDVTSSKLTKLGMKSDLQSQFDALLADVEKHRDFSKPTIVQTFKNALNAMKDAVKQKFESRNVNTSSSENTSGPSVR